MVFRAGVLAACLLGALGGRARAQSSQERAPVTEGRPKFSPPVLLRRVAAQYPKEALAAGLAGTVVLEFNVDEHGKVDNVVVKQGAGHGLDEAALAAVRQFEWKPAMNDRTPVPARVTYAYKFVLRQGGEASAQPGPDRMPPSGPAPKVVLEGSVLLRGSRAPVAHGRVIAVPAETAALRQETETDDAGHFSLALAPGRYRMIVNGPGATRFEAAERLGARERVIVHYYLEPSQYGRYQSIVRADLNREEISRRTLSTEELVKMPGTMGDALRAIENLPGVARAPFNSGLIIIRGGKPTDSRVLMAGAEIPQLYHFGGFTSTVPTQLIDHVDYLPGNFGVRYGRAIAGAIDVDLREGKRDRLHGAGETNLFDTGLMLEGPVGKGSFVVAARRSYIDAVLAATLPASAGLRFTTAPVYYDYQAILDYPLWKGRFRAFAFGSDDQLRFTFSRPQDSDPQLTDFATHILYHRLQLRWMRSAGSWQLSAQNSTGYNGTTGRLGRTLAFDVGVIESDTRAEARYSGWNRLKLLLGVDTQYATVSLAADVPTPIREGEIPSPLSTLRKEHAHEVLNIFNAGLYAEAVWKPNVRLTLTSGLRLDYFSALRRLAFNPRLTARLELGSLTTLKAGVGLFSQDPQPPDFDPNFGNPKVRPESAVHYGVTLERALFPGAVLEATGFYKQLYDLIAPTQNYVMRGGAAIPERVTNAGSGRVYGLELLARQSLSRWFFGWVSYTLMRSERRDCSSCPVRLFDFDQTHVLVFALHAYLPRGFEAGLRFRYISGFPYTPAHGGFYDADADVYAPAKALVNTARLAAFNQLDLRIDKTFLFERWQLKVYLDLTNVYNNANQEQIQYSFDYTRAAPVTGLPIIPSFGVRGEF